MKKSSSDFAVCGGPAVFAEPLIVGRPGRLSRDAFLRRIDAMLDSGQLTNDGPLLQEFEHQLQRTLGVRHVIAVCNGTAALQVMIAASQLTGEVIVPSMTFVATAHALQWLGLTPVFADIDPETHTLDPGSVERCLSDRTSAILGVHVWGNPCAADALQHIADQHGLKLLFDASHAFGCTLGTRRIGTLGDAEAFSFHATKVMHAVEGGAITTNDDGIAHRCRLMRNFGITGHTQIDSLGINAKMSELSAAAGLTSLENLPHVIQHNRHNLQTYRSVLARIPGLEIALPDDPRNAANGQYVVVRVNAQEFGMSRDVLVPVLRAEGVFVRAYFLPGCHHAEPYIGKPQHQPVPLPVTEHLLTEVMQLPTGGMVDAQQIQTVAKLLMSVHRHAVSLERSLQTTLPHWHPSDPAKPRCSDQLEAA